MTVEERVLRLENAFATLEELAARSDGRTSDLEKHFKMLTQLIVSASERADTHEAWINRLGEAQANASAQIAALADAQIRTEEALTTLTARVDRIAALVEKNLGSV